MLQLQRADLNLLLEAPPLQILHRNELLTLKLAEFIDGRDMRMTQRCSSLSFTLEPFLLLGASQRLQNEKFECNRPFQAGVLGFVHHAHSSLADLGEYSVACNRLANHGVSPTIGKLPRGKLAVQRVRVKIVSYKGTIMD